MLETFKTQLIDDLGTSLENLTWWVTRCLPVITSEQRLSTLNIEDIFKDYLQKFARG